MNLRERLALMDPFDLDDEEIDVLRQAFECGDGKLQEAAIDGLEGVTDERALAAILELVRNRAASPEVRGRAAIALGPALEMHDFDRDDPFPDAAVASEIAEEMQRVLLAILGDQSEPKLVRRRALEASIRCYEEEHAPLIRRLWIDPDVEWRMTAMFCMGYAAGFEREIIAAVRDRSMDDGLRAEALRTAGRRGMREVRKTILAAARDEQATPILRRGALEAAAELAPKQAKPILRGVAAHGKGDLRELAKLLLEEVGGEDDAEDS